MELGRNRNSYNISVQIQDYDISAQPIHLYLSTSLTILALNNINTIFYLLLSHIIYNSDWISMQNYH